MHCGLGSTVACSAAPRSCVALCSPVIARLPTCRAASIARKVYMRNGVGVGALRRIYGKAKNNGVRPEHFSKASGSIIRSILKNLETVRRALRTRSPTCSAVGALALCAVLTV